MIEFLMCFVKCFVFNYDRKVQQTLSTGTESVCLPNSGKALL